MTRRAGAALIGASAVYVFLVASAAAKIGLNYEEIVPYVLTPLDIRDGGPPVVEGNAPRFVVSRWLPTLAFEPTAGLRLPLLNQLYMTNHLSYGGVALAAATGLDRLWAARAWHAAFGLVLLWLLYDVAVLLGLGTRAALVAVAVAATSLHVTICYAIARFDESTASFGTVTVLWAALRYARGREQRWVWVGTIAATVAVTGKITALWTLAALAIAGALAGWRPPPVRSLARPALAAVPLFLPMVCFAVAGRATGEEVGRRLGFIADLFTTDVIVRTGANLIAYLGTWGSVMSQVARGADARGPNVLGQLLVSATLAWLLLSVVAPGSLPRRRRLETHMLAFVAVVFAFVALFFREHQDYQFLLLVPLHALALAAFLDWCARRFLDHRLSPWAVGIIVCAIPVASNLWDQRGLHADLRETRNPMSDVGAQRASAVWLTERGAQRPIVVTFYAVGTYEILTDGVVRPVYAFPLFRHPKSRLTVPDYTAVWRDLLAEGNNEARFVVLPVGVNPVEASHFDEAAIRQALFKVAPSDRAAVFSSQRGEALLELWRVTPRQAGRVG